MQISNELSEQILECALQIKTKFGINIGYSHPMYDFSDLDNDDFVIYREGQWNDSIQNFDCGLVYIIENNKYEYHEHGVFVARNVDLEKQTEACTNFLMDFVTWIKSGQIRVEKYREFKNWKWKPAGDGRFHVEKDNGDGYKLGCCKELDELDPEIRDHIQSIYFGE